MSKTVIKTEFARVKKNFYKQVHVNMNQHVRDHYMDKPFAAIMASKSLSSSCSLNERQKRNETLIAVLPIQSSLYNSHHRIFRFNATSSTRNYVIIRFNAYRVVKEILGLPVQVGDYYFEDPSSAKEAVNMPYQSVKKKETVPPTSFFLRPTAQLMRSSAPRYPQAVWSSSVWLYCHLSLDLREEREREIKIFTLYAVQ